MTANGTRTSDGLALARTPLGSQVATVLRGSPNLLSMGELHNQGYGFYWPPGESPTLELPDGSEIEVPVEGNVPTISRAMVVRGDGALMSTAQARTRPIETILSGPAASIVGACSASKRKTRGGCGSFVSSRRAPHFLGGL